MRAGFGLLSLLIVAGLVFYLTFGTKSHPGYDAAVLEQGKTAREEAAQVSGRTDDSTPISETIQLDEVDAGGQFRRLKVLSVRPSTPMDTIYGLKVGDEIVKVGDMGVSDNNDAGLAKALVYEAYGRNEPLVVLRNDQQITLTPTASPLSKMGKSSLLQGQAIPTH